MAAGRRGEIMKAPPFRYIKPSTLEECLDLMGRHASDAQILAGGQSLMPMLNMRLAAPAVLIDINGLYRELEGINGDGDQLVIGALTRHAAIAASPLVARHAPLLAAAAPHIAHVAIRSRGTIGGSLALADPVAEWPACCLALGAEIELASRAGRRRVLADDYFQGLYTTARRDDELVMSVRVPIARGDHACAFQELARRRGDFAIVGVALTARRTGGVMRDVRVALMGVADRPLLARGTMAALEDAPLGGLTVQAALKALASEIDPPGDDAYPADYRRHVAGVLAGRCIETLCNGPVHAA